MIRNFKALGLTFIAMAAVGGTMASTAQAGSLHIIPVQVLTGHSVASQQHILSVTFTNETKGNAVCDTASFEGAAEGFAITEEIGRAHV